MEGIACEACVTAEGAEIFGCGESGIEGELLRDPTDCGAGGGRCGGRAEDGDAAGVGIDAADDGADESAFACAVGAKKAETLSGAEFEGDIVDGRDRAEALDETGDDERGGMRRGHGIG